MSEESLGETLLQVATMMLISIVLALIVMGALGVSFRPPPERAKPSHPAAVHTAKPPRDHPKHPAGSNP
jgi:hypothetical protein